jgi:hypothetical protein
VVGVDQLGCSIHTSGTTKRSYREPSGVVAAQKTKLLRRNLLRMFQENFTAAMIVAIN